MSPFQSSWVIPSLAFGVIMVLLSACQSPDEDPPAQNYNPTMQSFDVNYVHAAPELDELWCAVGNDTGSFYLPYGVQTYYFSGSAYDHHGVFFVGPASNPVGSSLAETFSYVNDDHHYSAYVIGHEPEQDIEILITSDTYTAPPSGRSLVRFANFCPNATITCMLYNVITHESIRFDDRVYDGLNDGEDLTAFLEVDAGDYQIMFDGDDDDVWDYMSSVTAPDREAITVSATGLFGASFPNGLTERVVWH